MRTLLLLLFCNGLYAQQWVFNQGYILEDSTVSVLNRQTIVNIHPNMIQLNTLELIYDRFETRDSVLTFYLADGGLLLYAENEHHGPGIVVMYQNVRIVLWTYILETFEIDIR